MTTMKTMKINNKFKNQLTFRMKKIKFNRANYKIFQIKNKLIIKFDLLYCIL